MLHRLISFLLLLTPVFACAQWVSPEYNQIVKEHCRGVIFTKYERLASLKVSKQEFEDSLAACLKANHAYDTGAKFVVQFLLTKQSMVVDPQKINGSMPKSGFLKCFEGTSQFWVPAIQNEHAVCAFVKCEIEIKQDRLSVRIFQ